MFIDTSRLEPDSKKIWYKESYINTNNIIYVSSYFKDRSKSIIHLLGGTEALIYNNVDEVCRLLNEFEKND